MRRATIKFSISGSAISISIHALLAESDKPTTGRNDQNNVFLSTLSLRRATASRFHLRATFSISIHALLAESDVTGSLRRYVEKHFYPRSPCGERPLYALCRSRIADFYPRSPCGERLYVNHCFHHPSNYFYPRSPCGERREREPALSQSSAFLSTLSLRRATRRHRRNNRSPIHFYPRSPCGERLILLIVRKRARVISIHALLAESDQTFYWMNRRD